MSEKPQARIRKKKVEPIVEEKVTTPTSNLKEKAKKHMPMQTITPAPTVEKLDLSAFEEDSFGLSMDDIFADAVTKRFQIGEVVDGTVCGFQADAILVDIQAKSEAVLQVEDPSTFAIGDAIQAKIIRMDGRGIYLAQKISKRADASAYQVAYEQKLPVEGSVESANKGGFVISFGSIRGFCPMSQITFGIVKAEDHIGKSYEFLITELKSDELIVSRKKLIEKERFAKRDQRLAELHIGQNLMGTVLTINQFGAFVDLNGVDGLIPRAEFSNIGEDVSEGDELEVCIKQLNGSKITLSAPSSNPWLKMGTEFRMGGIYTATVTKEKEFGFFAKLAPNLEGLLHRSNLTDAELDECTIGTDIQVRIQDFDVERKRISLTLAQGQQVNENTAEQTLGDAFGDIFAQFGFTPTGTKK